MTALRPCARQRYADGAREAGHEVRIVDGRRVSTFRCCARRRTGKPRRCRPALLAAQQAIAWAAAPGRVLPALARRHAGAAEGLPRAGRAAGLRVRSRQGQAAGTKLLGGRSARVVVTMGMPALVYRWYFRAHSVKALERNILGFVGIAPVRRHADRPRRGHARQRRARWLERLRESTKRRVTGRMARRTERSLPGPAPAQRPRGGRRGRASTSRRQAPSRTWQSGAGGSPNRALAPALAGTLVRGAARGVDRAGAAARAAASSMRRSTARRSAPACAGSPALTRLSALLGGDPRAPATTRAPDVAALGAERCARRERARWRCGACSSPASA